MTKQVRPAGIQRVFVGASVRDTIAAELRFAQASAARGDTVAAAYSLGVARGYVDQLLDGNVDEWLTWHRWVADCYRAIWREPRVYREGDAVGFPTAMVGRHGNHLRAVKVLARLDKYAAGITDLGFEHGDDLQAIVDSARAVVRSATRSRYDMFPIE